MKWAKWVKKKKGNLGEEENRMGVKELRPQLVAWCNIADAGKCSQLGQARKNAERCF